MSLLSNEELEERLSAAGNSLLQPPSSLDELLTLLDQTEELLSKVEQSPPKSMQTVLSPLMKALVSEELLKHSDIDVKVGVASCISEITRITAPDAPYDDEKMKDVFQLIVSSFDNISDTSSRSHQKKATILETVAKVRSCVIMLDLECDQMIIQMFQYFLKFIRVYHAEVIFASMETIMTLVLEESEDVSPNLLNPILDALKRNNKEVLPIAKKLAKRVIQNCADKLRPYLIHAVNTLNASLDDYNGVVASACHKNSGGVGHSDENNIRDPRVAKDVKEEIKPRDKDPAEDVKEEIKPQEKDPALIGSSKSIASNSINGTGDEETVTDENLLKKAKCEQQFDAKSTSKTDSDDMDALKPAQLEVKVGHFSNGEAQQFDCRNNSAESSDLLNDEKQAEQVRCHQENPSEKIHSLPGELPPVEADKPLDTVKGTAIQLLPSEEAEIEAVNKASPIQIRSLPNENQPKRSVRTKRKENMVKEEKPSADTVCKKASEGANIAEVNKKQHMTKNQHKEIINMDKAFTEGAPKNAGGTMSDSEARRLDAEKLEDASNKKKDGSSSKQDGRRRGRVKPKFEKDTLKDSAAEDNGKDRVASLLTPLKSTIDKVSQEETPRISTKRKHTAGTDYSSQTMQYGENLVGSKVKVWWPKDRMFYEGVIAAFDSVKKKHKVSYDDGDEEILNLRRERWEFVGHGSVLDGGLSVEHSSHNASSNKENKKKGHANSETSHKHGKMEDPPRRKPKDNAKESGSKSEDDGKAEPASKCNSEDETDKSEDHSQKLEGQSSGSTAKASGRSQHVDVARTTSHTKQDIRRISNSKGKTPQGGKALSPIGIEMKKSSSLKVKEIVQMERAMGSAKSPGTLKGSKSQESGIKSGKKRRR